MDTKSVETGQFNIRVYGIAIENNNILLSDEVFNGITMTKFPGGGLKFGEGTIDCLKREAKEEFNRDIEIIAHFYTTDYFQPALFFINTQLISIYYKFKIIDKPVFPVSETPDYPGVGGMQNFRWAPISSLVPGDLTFPVDRKIAEQILKEFNGS